jgi:hypothetical protein
VSSLFPVRLLPGCPLQAATAPQQATTEIHIPLLIMVFISLSSLECAAR